MDLFEAFKENRTAFLELNVLERAGNMKIFIIHAKIEALMLSMILPVPILISLVWKLIMFIAFAVFELFRFTTVAQEACKNRSCMKFARDMLQQLVEVSWDVIENSPILQKHKVQFRFRFCDPP